MSDNSYEVICGLVLMMVRYDPGFWELAYRAANGDKEAARQLARDLGAVDLLAEPAEPLVPASDGQSEGIRAAARPLVEALEYTERMCPATTSVQVDAHYLRILRDALEGAETEAATDD